MSARAIEYDDEGRPTLATASGNRVVLGFAVFGRGQGKVDVCWKKYPPSAADVEECTRWIEEDLLPNQVKIGANAYDLL